LGNNLERGGREGRERGIDRAGDKEEDKRWKEGEG
jgi:hypothetical protein